MSIQINGNLFLLNTARTTYAFTVKNGAPVHLYYGERLESAEGLELILPNRMRSFQPYYAEQDKNLTLDELPLEYSFFDSPDLRMPSAVIKNANGGYISRFVFEDYSLTDGRPEIAGLPCGKSADGVQTLAVNLTCVNVKVTLYYCVYPEIDVIVRFASVLNGCDGEISLKKFVSASLDFKGGERKLLTLQGRVATERARRVLCVPQGRYTLSSSVGSSSHSASPFFMLADGCADENHGDVYAFNLVYSGNFSAQTEFDDRRRLRAEIGVNCENFSVTLGKGETFCSPEVMLTYSANGYNGVSIAQADYIRKHIMPARHAFAPRPVVINTWEAFYFDINEDKMLDLARLAKKCDIDTLVIDDGWFSTRRNDDSGLGDWTVAPEVLPHGLKEFSKKVRALGLNLGIWIEPEMVNPDSRLYRAHPEWALGEGDVLSRNQLVLDMTNPAVVDYIYESLEKVLSGTEVTYVKWDMNRYLRPFLSAYTKNSEEVAHKYMLGVYDLMGRLTRRFPEILLENCSGGGGRFDAGMMQYSPQIWTSDDTCPFERAFIQAGASYAYPVSAQSCHVTVTPNGGTRLITSMDFRFGMALNGALGYELNLFELSDEECAKVREQIAFYRKKQKLMLEGDFYRLVTPFDDSRYYAWISVSKDKNEALLCCNVLESGCNAEDLYLRVYGLSDDKVYKIGDDLVSGKVLRCGGIKIPAAPQSGYTYIFELKSI